MKDLASDYLQKSWKRSKKYGADIIKAKDAILQDFELRQYREKKERFLKKVLPTIEQLAHSLKPSNSVVVISNSSGILLESMGDPTFLQDTEKIHLLPGACWAEQVRGTNSAGTVSVEKKPIAVIGQEHYLESHHMFFCVGSPIFDQNGELQVVLNVSGHSELYHPSMLGMVDIISRNIENWMIVRQPVEQLVISLYPERNKGHEALIAVDQHGQVIGTNREARYLLDFDEITKNHIYIEELFSNTKQLLSNKSRSPENPICLYTKNDEQSLIYASVIFDSYARITSSSSGKTKKQFPVKALNTSNYKFTDIYGEDKVLESTLAIAKRAAGTNYTIVIIGESGTGKEMVSQAIHHDSPRSNKPFVALNCGGITKSLMESELFGYEAGAFTGAKQSGQPGVFEQADGGTLFLDEIAELSMDIQIALLRVLQDFQVTRIGGTKPVQVDVRIITATHTDLWQNVQDGSFRADLFYRLQGVHVKIPPFREREDRLNLAKILLKEIQRELGKEALMFSSCADQLIEGYSWPGNVRQVSSAIREAAFLTLDNTIDVRSFPTYILSDYQHLEKTGSLLQDTENKLILDTMNKTNNNISESARILGISRNTLYRKLKGLNWG